MSFLYIDKSQPEISEALAGCEVGVPKTLTITVTPVVDTDVLFGATVDSVEYSEEDPIEEAEEDAEPAVAAYKPKAKSGSATAVEAMV